MSLADELLEHARFLAHLVPGHTSQASLRRAVSTAYYAVFLLFSAEVAVQVSPSFPAGLRERTQRALHHKQMLTVANAVSQVGGKPGNLPPDIKLPEPISIELSFIASGFKNLQEARHAADYDLTRSFDRTDVVSVVKSAEDIFKNGT